MDEVFEIAVEDRSKKFVLWEEESWQRNEPRGTFYSREEGTEGNQGRENSRELLLTIDSWYSL
jgi:hypothetical protein